MDTIRPSILGAEVPGHIKEQLLLQNLIVPLLKKYLFPLIQKNEAPPLANTSSCIGFAFVEATVSCVTMKYAWLKVLVCIAYLCLQPCT